MPNILITSKNFDVAAAGGHRFFPDGYAILDNPYLGKKMPPEELRRLIADADGFLLGMDQVDAAVLEAAPRLRVVAKFGVGLDTVDIPAATARGVAVANVPATTAVSVADLTMGLMLGVSKLIVYTNRRVLAGMWPQDRGHDITGKTLGIVGFGRIGQAVAKRARGFDMTVLAYDPQFNEAAARELGVVRATLDAITETADYITLHIPLTPEVRHLFDAARLARMKPGSYLINAARGGLVDEDALYDALQSGHLAGAALDVLDREPPPERPRLFDCENCLVTSHSGGNSLESIFLTAKGAADNIVAVLEGKPCPNVVNAAALK
ncbi:MAG: phosphoglycerate dehydrogenase [Planctomycetes bacterium]|nr:phosphoglycerate dehydrogenase [Planctomycetota bacterium]